MMANRFFLVEVEVSKGDVDADDLFKALRNGKVKSNVWLLDKDAVHRWMRWSKAKGGRSKEEAY